MKQVAPGLAARALTIGLRHSHRRGRPAVADREEVAPTPQQLRGPESNLRTLVLHHPDA